MTARSETLRRASPRREAGARKGDPANDVGRAQRPAPRRGGRARNAHAQAGEGCGSALAAPLWRLGPPPPVQPPAPSRCLGADLAPFVC